MILTLVFSACSRGETKEENNNTQQTKTSQQTETPEKGDESNVTPAGEFPIVKEKITFSAFITPATAIPTDDFDNNAFTKWVEEKTNISFNFTVVPTQDREQKLNIMLSSGDYPELILGGHFTESQLALYGGQGILIPLNDLIEKYGVETKKVMSENPWLESAITMPNGNIYALPYIDDCYHCTLVSKMWIYRPWLDNLGLEMPNTTEEFYQVLKAFKERDPNKNGKKDEIPLAGSDKAWEGNPVPFLMNSFVYTSAKHNYLYVDNGKVTASFNQPGWKEGLKYLNRLVEDGLMARETFTQDGEQLKAMGTSNILGAAPGGYTGNMADITQGQKGEWLNWEAVPPLEGPQGVRYAGYYPNRTIRGSFAITDKCKNPEAAFRLGDMFYNIEVGMMSRWGRIGVEWDYVKDGEVGINGEPAKWKYLVDIYSYDQKNFSWGTNINWYAPSYWRLAQSVGATPEEAETNNEVVLYNASLKYEPYKPSEDMVLPALVFDEEQTRELSEIQTTIRSYVDETIARAATGDIDIEKEWDSYLNELEKMNLARLLEIYQAAYDAKYKK